MTEMAHPHHHAISSARRWGGVPEDYIAIHNWFDESKKLIADFRHRALRHHSEGIFMAESIFGVTITLSTCGNCGHAKDLHPRFQTEQGVIYDHQFVEKEIPVRWVGEQHVEEDMGFIPSATDWLKQIAPMPWMSRSRHLSRELEGTHAG